MNNKKKERSDKRILLTFILMIAACTGPQKLDLKI